MALEFHQGVFPDAEIVRRAVFMDEQGFANEFEPLDSDDATLHVTAYVDDALVGCARAFPVPAPSDRERLGCPFIPSPTDDNPTSEGVWVFGRLAVLPDFRGQSLGSAILAKTEEIMADRGAVEVHLHAQCDKSPFYASRGYQAYGEVEMDEHVPHQWMMKRL